MVQDDLEEQELMVEDARIQKSWRKPTSCDYREGNKSKNKDKDKHTDSNEVSSQRLVLQSEPSEKTGLAAGILTVNINTK